LVDVKVLDHFIVAGASALERDWLASPNGNFSGASYVVVCELRLGH
jgi:hypothetical protein